MCSGSSCDEFFLENMLENEKKYSADKHGGRKSDDPRHAHVSQSGPL
jgi:hypothetical protein